MKEVSRKGAKRAKEEIQKAKGILRQVEYPKIQKKFKLLRFLLFLPFAGKFPNPRLQSKLQDRAYPRARFLTVAFLPAHCSLLIDYLPVKDRINRARFQYFSRLYRQEIF